MEPAILKRESYRVIGVKQRGCFRCVVMATSSNYIKTTTYYSVTSRCINKRKRCGICRNDKLTQVLRGRKKCKAQILFKSREKPGISVDNITITEKIDRKCITNKNFPYEHSFEEIKEVLEELAEEEVEEAHKKEEKGQNQPTTSTEKWEEENNSDESEDTNSEAPTLRSDWTEDMQLKLLEEARVEVPAEIIEGVSTEQLLEGLEDMPFVTESKTFQQILDSFEQESGQDTCERYVSDYVPPEYCTRGKCKVCLCNNINTVFFPCRHAVLCCICADTFPECPICRSIITDRIGIQLC